MAKKVDEIGDDGTNDLLVSEVIRTNEFPALRKSNGNPSRKVWPRMMTRCDVP
jgi:hypothetical protein